MANNTPNEASESLTPREPSALALIASLVVLFLGAGVIGVTLAETFAPDSFLAAFVGLFALPLAFGLGIQLWMGVALFRAILVLLGARRRSGAWVRRSPTGPIPGTWVFLPISSAAGAIAGMIVGLLSSAYSGWLAWLVFWTVGTLHGLTARRLARAGYLMPPEEM
ncbi:MAG: hypothetical protein K0S86_902 [Geminicoccaceae bacterium]|nr:hypothetical protein [Geminicoccaceae bacterium]